jgi:hypothetical protein
MRNNDFGQSYIIKHEYETDNGFVMETNLGTFYHQTDWDDNEWLDDSLGFTTRQDFLNNNWKEME